MKRQLLILGALMVGLSVGSASAQIKAPCPCSPGTLFVWHDSMSVEFELDSLVTDRPDFTEASSTVGQRVAQIEFGYTFTSDNDGVTTTREHSWGEPLLRLGVLANWLEFRIAAFPVTTSSRTANVRQTSAGSDDLYMGFKLALTPQCGILPETAIMPQWTVPTGSAGRTAGTFLVGANYLYSWELSEQWSLAGSTQFNRALDMTGREYTEFAQSIAVGRSLTDSLGLYAETYATFPAQADTALPEYYFNGGFAWLLSDDVQWDIRAGLGLNDGADDFFAGTGFSIRFH